MAKSGVLLRTITGCLWLLSANSSLSSPVRLSFFLAKTNKKNAPLAEINVAGRAAVAWGV